MTIWTGVPLTIRNKHNIILSTRAAGILDVPRILEVAKEFFFESGYAHLTFDGDQYSKILHNCASSEDIRIFIAEANNEIAGYVIVCLAREYTVENVGETYQFYVRERYRGTNAARSLVDAAIRQFDLWNCVLSYVVADPRMRKENNKLFSNLWKKFGYMDSGIQMVRERG